MRLIATTLKALAAVAGAAVFSAVSLVPNAQPAWAPEMVGLELAAQRALGWTPCEPVLSQIPFDLQEAGVLADAATTEMFGECKIRFAANVPADALDWVAWHEVAHLSTMDAIHADPAHEHMEDPYHCHPLFLAAIAQGPAETGGYGPEHCEQNH